MCNIKIIDAYKMLDKKLINTQEITFQNRFEKLNNLSIKDICMITIDDKLVSNLIVTKDLFKQNVQNKELLNDILFLVRSINKAKIMNFNPLYYGIISADNTRGYSIQFIGCANIFNNSMHKIVIPKIVDFINTSTPFDNTTKIEEIVLPDNCEILLDTNSYKNTLFSNIENCRTIEIRTILQFALDSVITKEELRFNNLEMRILETLIFSKAKKIILGDKCKVQSVSVVKTQLKELILNKEVKSILYGVYQGELFDDNPYTIISTPRNRIKINNELFIYNRITKRYTNFKGKTTRAIIKLKGKDYDSQV